MKLDVEFCFQNGEGGPVPHGLSMWITDVEIKHTGFDYLAYIYERIARELIEFKNQQIAKGYLWEGAYLVTHPHDEP